MNKRLILGLGLVLFGVLFLIGNLVPQFSVGEFISDFWPVVLIIFGLYNILRRDLSRRIYHGIFLILVGLIFLVDSLGFIYFDFLPVIISLALIWIGLSFIFRRHKVKDKTFKGRKNYYSGKEVISETEETEDTVVVTSYFASIETLNKSPNFIGGVVTATFGSVRIDLRGANLSEFAGVLELHSSFGEIEIFIPSEWNILIKPQAVLGSVDNLTRNRFDLNAAYLEIRAKASLGTVRLMN